MKIAYYITGHGLGHATRSLYSIQYLLNKSNIIYIITSINSTFFQDNLKQTTPSNNTTTTTNGDSYFYIINRTLDSGAIQKGPLCIDGNQTLERYYNNIYLKHNELLNNEINFLKENNIELIITDATPIACNAGSKLGIKVIILSNFTWDRMYDGMLNEIQHTLDEETIRNYRNMITQCSLDYSYANFYIQLPGAVSLPPDMIQTKHSYGPLIGRYSLHKKEEILKQYSINHLEFKHILLIGFGGHDMSWNIFHEDFSLPSDWICLILGGTETTNSTLSIRNNIISIPYNCYVPDLISISSVVLGKLGYGFMSECLIHQVPMIYLTRSCWPEEIYLKNYMETYQNSLQLNCLEMKYDDFINGNWESYLLQCIPIPNTNPNTTTNPTTNENEIENNNRSEEIRMEDRRLKQDEYLDKIFEVLNHLNEENNVEEEVVAISSL